ncbi:leucine rich adaptor protein 1 [Pungitius pungitius]|uniref:leucine rich adaptor protein 1 n=1 Tax=Pungitius pungitius TaxID=134920 RepID=UPI002E0DD454
MDECTADETIPDLKDIEGKIGRKTPEALLRGMREEAPSLRGEAKQTHGPSEGTGKKGLDEKIRILKMEMVHLRSVDVKLLHQLLAVHEGIEALKWLLEERSTLTSRCSSLTSSQYSLGEGLDTSWRGSWSSLQDPNDKLDNISVGSYLDTLADDMDEYCPSGSESVICSTALFPEAAAGGRTAGGPGGAAGVGVSGTKGKGGAGVPGVSGDAVAADGKPAVAVSSAPAKSEGPKQHIWTTPSEGVEGSPVLKEKTRAQVVKANGAQEKTVTHSGSPTRAIDEKRQSGPTPKLKPYKNGMIDLDTCKMNGKMHLEYDAHWRWVQSQEDVTFL